MQYYDIAFHITLVYCLSVKLFWITLNINPNESIKTDDLS